MMRIAIQRGEVYATFQRLPVRAHAHNDFIPEYNDYKE